MAGWLGGWEQWLVGESCGVGMEIKRMGGVRGCVFVQSSVMVGGVAAVWGEEEVGKDCDGRNGGFVGRMVGMDMPLNWMDGTEVVGVMFFSLRT